MTSFRQHSTRREARIASRTLRWVTRPAAIGATLIAFAMATVFAIAPPAPPSAAERLHELAVAHAQTLQVADHVVPTSTRRDSFSATPGIVTLAQSGTNYDWAKLVLTFAKLPVTDDNVTVFTRWMRQENGADNWWNRNNPLNNGYGSGGGGGTGSYPNLVVAAKMCAESFTANPGYAGFVAAFRANASTSEIERAIWASNWAAGHYANGGHWRRSRPSHFESRCEAFAEPPRREYSGLHGATRAHEGWSQRPPSEEVSCS